MTARPNPNPVPPAEVVENTLQEHNEWLRMTPCTSREIADHLFPAANRGSKPERDLILTITALMWDSGFTPSSRGKGYSRWYWREEATPKVPVELAEMSR